MLSAYIDGLMLVAAVVVVVILALGMGVMLKGGLESSKDMGVVVGAGGSGIRMSARTFAYGGRDGGGGGGVLSRAKSDAKRGELLVAAHNSLKRFCCADAVGMWQGFKLHASTVRNGCDRMVACLEMHKGYGPGRLLVRVTPQCADGGRALCGWLVWADVLGGKSAEEVCPHDGLLSACVERLVSVVTG